MLQLKEYPLRRHANSEGTVLLYGVRLIIITSKNKEVSTWRPIDGGFGRIHNLWDNSFASRMKYQHDM